MYNDAYVNEGLKIQQVLNEYGGVAVLGEQRDGKIMATTYELINWGIKLASELNQPLICYIIGGDVSQVEQLTEYGVDAVYHVKHDSLAHFLARPYSRAIAQLVEMTKPAILIGAATTTGRTVMPLVAAMSNTGLTADCTGLDIERDTGLLLQTRPAIGGNIMATIKTPECRPQMATVRPRSAKPASKQLQKMGSYNIIEPKAACLITPERFLEFVKDTTKAVSIDEADVIVAGGKGFKSAEGFKLVERTATALGAAVGASRDAVELGWVSYPHQIGLSGKTVSPKLLFACGISGKIQFLAGMQTAEVVVAINKDPEAQIFKVADYGIVGDVFDVLPRLIEAIGKRTTLLGGAK